MARNVASCQLGGGWRSAWLNPLFTCQLIFLYATIAGMSYEEPNPKTKATGRGKTVASPRRVVLVILALVLFYAGRFAYDVNKEFGQAAPLEERLAAEQARPKPEPVTDPIVLAVQEAESWIDEGRIDEGLARIRALAEAGHAEAQRRLGVLYDEGRGVAQSYEMAIEWYQKAIELGDAKAMYNLAQNYFHGEGVEKDFKAVIRFASPLSGLGDRDAYFLVGRAFKKLGDKANAIYWMTLSSKGGVRPADYLLWLYGETYYGPPMSMLERLCVISRTITRIHSSHECE